MGAVWWNTEVWEQGGRDRQTRGQMDKMVRLHSVTLGCQRGTDGQTDRGALQCHTRMGDTDGQTDGGLCGVTPGGGAADEQAVRWTGWTQGSSASAPGEMDG